MRTPQRYIAPMSNPSNVFITGASSGIGAATALLLVRSGHRVFGCARRENQLQSVADRLSSDLRHNFVTRALDVMNVEDHLKAVSDCASTFGSIDVAIPNAGLGIFENLADAALEDWHTMVDVNIKGVLNTLHCCLPHLKASKGLVVNIGSVASRKVFAESGVYCATKHAVLALGEAIRQDLKSEVASTTVCPGAVDTAFIEQTRNPELLNQFRPNFKKGMRPEFVAEHVLYAIESRGNGIVSDITLRPDFI